MFHDLFQWLQDVPGAVDGDPTTSWSQQFAGSLNLWALTEGTHVVSLMLFAGTIFLVDLRMLGVMFRATPYSTLNAKVLPLTIAGFALVAVTGALLFFSNPLHYYHSAAFRLKLIFIIAAAVNIFWFHSTIQKNQAAWDEQANPPFPVKLAAGISLASWIIVIVLGRLMALNAVNCDGMRPGTLGYAFAECDVGVEAELVEEAPAPEEAPPPDTSTPDAPAPDGEAKQ